MLTASAHPPEALLEVDQLCIDFLNEGGEVRVVDGVSFEVRPGEIVGLAGESGSGKSTTLKGLLRILGPPAVITGGRALFRGQDVLEMSEDALRRLRWGEISMVMQSAMNALNPVLTVGEQIIDVLVAHRGVHGPEARERVATLLELVGIEAVRANSYPHELSGGMRQRVVVAMALALEPALVFMDEPTTALDVVVQKEILDQISRLQASLGFAILLITHDLALMMSFCDRIGILYAGRLVESAPAEVLRDDARHPYTQGLMAASPDIARQDEVLYGLPGTPPDPRDPPTGCSFHPRCPAVMPRCRIERPPSRRLGPDHDCACWLYE